MKKKELSPEALKECAALKAIFVDKRDELGLTQEKAAAALGMNQGSFSHYLNGRNALNLSFASSVAKLLGVRVSDFSPRLASEMAEMAAYMDGYQKGVELGQVVEKSFGSSEHANVRSVAQPWRRPGRYPLISWVAAGARAESPELLGSPNNLEYLESTENAGEHGYWLSVRGPSMTAAGPTSFPEGTRILVRPEGFDLISGKYYIAQHRDGEMTFKQYLYDAGVEYLVPLNPTFKTIELDHEWEVIGRVIDAKIPGL